MIGKIINDEKFEEAQDRLNLWANSALMLEEQYFRKNNEVSNRDYDFLKLIGQNVYSLNLFNSLIISSIENKIRDLRHEKNSNNHINQLESLSRYLRFYNSLIASKIKFFFFREKPIRNTNNPSVDLDFEILKTANKLLHELSNNQLTSIDNLKSLSAKYFFYQNLLYAFIYNSEKDKGLFLSFKFDIDIFTQLKEIILSKINAIESEKELREFGSLLIAALAEFYATLGSQEKVNDFSFEYIQKPSCYNKLFNILIKEQKWIEPLTYHFSDIIWKIDGMVHDDNEFLDYNLKQIQENIVIKSLIDFSTKYFSEAERMYNDYYINFKDLFNIESAFFNEIYPIIFHQEPINAVRAKFNTIKDVLRNCNYKKKPIINCTANNLGLLSIFEKVRSSGERGFKMEALIETLNPSELVFFLRAYSEIIMNDLIEDFQTEFVGFYTSGVFLGHIINLFKAQTVKSYSFKNIWLFKTKPYVATHPIHIDEPEGDLSTIIVFDECLKTGFTYSLYESYLARNLYNSHISISAFSIFNFDYYQRLDFNNSPDIHSLMSLNHNLLPINVEEFQAIEHILTGNGFNIVLPIKDIDIASLIELISYENQLMGKPCQCIDLTFLLSDTNVIFSICYSFAEQILNLIKEQKLDKGVQLISGSSDGAVLSLITAFILKTVFKIDVRCGLDRENNTRPLIGIDLSLMTGFSLAYNYAIMRDGKFEQDQVTEYLMNYDLICTIMSSGNHRGNLFSLYHNK